MPEEPTNPPVAAAPTGPTEAERNAQDRAKRAEERAKTLEAEKAERAKQRQQKKDDAERQKATDLDSANKRIADLEARETAALERVAGMEKTRIDDALSILGEDDRKKAEKYRGKMGSDDFIGMVNDMFGKHEGGTPPDPKPMDAPPHAAPRGPKGTVKPQGIELSPETESLLKRRMRANSEPMKRLADAEHTGNQHKWVIPIERLIDYGEARSAGEYGKNKRLSAGQTKALLDEIS